MAKKKKAKNTELGLDENVEGLLCYALGWVTGIIFLVLEKKNKFVKFHAMQSLITFGAITVASIVLKSIFLWTAATLVNIIGMILWILLMIKAYHGEKYKLPVAGDIAEKQLKK